MHEENIAGLSEFNFTQGVPLGFDVITLLTGNGIMCCFLLFSAM